MPAEHLLICGASTRAAAFSALRAGLRPLCTDLFADQDLRLRCSVLRLTERYPEGFRSFLACEVRGPWMYTGGLENRPGLVQRWRQRRSLWGNAAAALARARDPEFVAEILRDANMPVPALRCAGEQAAQSTCWLVKPRRGAGGVGIRFAEEAGADTPSSYCQEYMEGQSCALLYLGDGHAARLLGMTRQLVGVSFLHAGPFRYCGSIGPLDPGCMRRPSLEALGGVLALQCGLRGLFGVDGILRDDVFYPVEINPRYTASVEVLEYATGLPAMALHAAVFREGRLPPGAATRRSDAPCVGKAILFAHSDLIFPGDGPWMAELRSPAPLADAPAFADIPAAGEHIASGHPILTFFARADSPSACEDCLRRIAADLDHWLYQR